MTVNPYFCRCGHKLLTSGEAFQGPSAPPWHCPVVAGGQGSPLPSLVLAGKMPSKGRNKLQGCLAHRTGEEGGKIQEVSISQACRGAG